MVLAFYRFCCCFNILSISNLIFLFFCFEIDKKFNFEFLYLRFDQISKRKSYQNLENSVVSNENTNVRIDESNEQPQEQKQLAQNHIRNYDYSINKDYIQFPIENRVKTQRKRETNIKHQTSISYKVNMLSGSCPFNIHESTKSSRHSSTSSSPTATANAQTNQTQLPIVHLTQQSSANATQSSAAASTCSPMSFQVNNQQSFQNFLINPNRLNSHPHHHHHHSHHLGQNHHQHHHHTHPHLSILDIKNFSANLANSDYLPSKDGNNNVSDNNKTSHRSNETVMACSSTSSMCSSSSSSPSTESNKQNTTNMERNKDDIIILDDDNNHIMCKLFYFNFSLLFKLNED